jgi:UDP-2-acetamido-2,6-beta-L-arabino-hexul-4-ose reductase
LNVLVTGAKGFVGKNLICNLKNIRDEKDSTHPDIHIDEIFEYDIDSTKDELQYFCKNSDFVFNLAGINRPEDVSEFMKGNLGFASDLLTMLEKANNQCPVMLSSSIQASLHGRYRDSEYGKSKLAGEKLLFEYADRTGAKVLVYRFPNLFGKWCRPNYNSVIATFCYNIANDLPIKVNDSSTELELVYIDDLVEEMIGALAGRENRIGKYCAVSKTYKVSLGRIAELLNLYKKMPDTLIMPSIPDDSFEKKLYSTYISYLPKEKAIYPFRMNVDDRGSFSELLKIPDYGQISVNVSKPGIIKGEHWHNSKWEIFIVVSGHGLIQERKIGTDEIIEYEVDGDHMQAVQMLPGYTHNIINLSDTENLVTIMWANEVFDPKRPDTFHEKVDNEIR